MARAAQAAGAPQPGEDVGAAAALVAGWIEPRRRLAARIAEPAAAFEQGQGWSLAKLVLVADAAREFIQGMNASPVSAFPSAGAGA